MHVLLVIAALQQVLPAGPLVAGGVADPREPRISIGAISSTLFADALESRLGLTGPRDAERDTHGVVQLGVNLPLVRFGAVAVSLQGGVISRFRLETSDNDALSADYVIALPLNYERGSWEGRVRLIHRSAHLGDELIQNTPIRRLEFDHEEIDALVARRFRRFRVYGGGALTLASSYDRDDWGLQIGADGRWPAGRRVDLVGGVDWQRHSIWAGENQFSGAAGLEVRGPAGFLKVQATFLTGATPLGEFFDDRESYWGLGLVLGPGRSFNGH